MQMRCRKGNVDTHSMRMPGVVKGKDVDLGLCQDGSGTSKRGEIVDLGKGARLLNSPMNLNESDRAICQ